MSQVVQKWRDFNQINLHALDFWQSHEGMPHTFRVCPQGVSWWDDKERATKPTLTYDKISLIAPQAHFPRLDSLVTTSHNPSRKEKITPQGLRAGNLH